MARFILVGGVLAATSGVASLVPAVFEYLDRGFLGGLGIMVVSLGVVLILGGGAAIRFGFRRRSGASMPAPVRAAVMANILFLAFCALEFSDGLVRRGGRVFYWTSILFLPALVMLCGQVLGQRWAWWVARTVTALFVVWFVGFIAVIPFADLRGSGGVAAPWYGRVYTACVSLLFASVSAYAFRSLGNGEARRYFGLPHAA